MAKEKSTRRLAAILATDVVGYSRLMNVDEAGTLTRMTAHLEDVFKPAITEHQGHIVKTTGDGLLAEFASAVEAVECAVHIQTTMAERVKDDPEDHRVLFRIGINLGDIISQQGDIFGDGVNVASRIEALADPGGVFVSQSVAGQIKGKIDTPLEDLGTHEVKNIPDPVHVFRMLLDGAEPGSPLAGAAVSKPQARVWATWLAAVLVAGIAAAVLWPSPPPPADKPAQKEKTAGDKAVKSQAKPGIAVLPFFNVSGDKAQEYLSDGMTEDLITDLSKISELSVISRTSTAGYKGRKFDIRQVGEQLGVRYVIEGSVRKAGEQIRINVQLIDALTGGHIWAERYDGDMKDIFSLEDKVLEKIVGSLALTLSEKERRRLASRGTENVVAHDLYLKGLFDESKFTRESNAEAKRLYKQALAIDPDYPLPYARLSQILQYDIRTGGSDDVEGDLEEAVRLAEKAVALDGQNPNLHWILSRAVARIHKPGKLKQGIKAMERAIELDPDFADAYAFLGQLYGGDGRPEDGLRSIETAMRMNPRFPFWYLFVRGSNYFIAGSYEKAIADLENAIDRSPTAKFLRWVLAATYAEAGQQDDAEWQVEELNSMGFTGNVRVITKTQPLQHPPFLKRYQAALRKAGIPE